MKKSIKVLVAVSLSLILSPKSDCTVEAKEHVVETCTFSLDGDAYQEQTVYDSSGEPLIFSVQTSSDSLSTFKTGTVTAGEKTISVSSIREKISYKIYISKYKKITRAYNGEYSILGYNVKSAVLSVDSSTKASYTLNCTMFSSSVTKILYAEIINNELKVTFKTL